MAYDITGAYGKLLDSLQNSKNQTTNLFQGLLGGISNQRQNTADNYAGIRTGIGESESAARSQIGNAYQAATDRVQAAPVSYRRPASAATVLPVMNVGADASTMNALRTNAANYQDANNAAMGQLYDMLGQSDQANRNSRLSDIGLAQAGDMSTLAALANAQRFGANRAEADAMQSIADREAQIQMDQITALSGLDQQTLSAIISQIDAEREAQQQAYQAERDRVGDNQFDRTFDQTAISNAVSVFNSMLSPVLDTIDPTSLFELWISFASELGIPVSDAISMAGSL